MNRSPLARLTSLLALAALLFVGAIGAAQPAAAHTGTSSRWPVKQKCYDYNFGTYCAPFVEIPYFIKTQTGAKNFRTAITNAVKAWNDTPTRVLFTEVTNPSSAKVTITSTTEVNGSNWGYGGWSATNGQITSGYVKLYSPTIGTASDSKVQGVAVHELGHVLALVHNSNSQSIMYTGYRSFNTPQQHDVDDIKAMYGG